MVIHCVIAISESGKVPALDRFFKRCLEASSGRENIQRFDVFRILFESCLGESLGFASKVSKLRNDFRVNFVIALRVERF